MSEIMEVNVDQKLDEVIAGNLVELSEYQISSEEQAKITENTVKLLGARNNIQKEADNYSNEELRRELDSEDRKREYELKRLKIEKEIEILEKEFELKKETQRFNNDMKRKEIDTNKKTQWARVGVDLLGVGASAVMTFIGYNVLKTLNSQNQMFETSESFTSTCGKEIARDIPKRMVGLFFKR